MINVRFVGEGKIQVSISNCALEDKWSNNYLLTQDDVKSLLEKSLENLIDCDCGSCLNCKLRKLLKGNTE